MYSSLIGMVQKAQQHAQEGERVNITQFSASFRGEHDSYEITFADGAWRCSCERFTGPQYCSHTMALERMLGTMAPTCSTVSK
jgi:hypothetical protein